MPETNTRGDKRISPKWLPPDLYDYLKSAAKKQKLTETAIVIQALRVHRANNILSKKQK